MRRLIVVGAALFVVLAASFSVAAYGGPETAASACGGKLVVSVSQKVVNDIDSGFGGNNWAYDNYNRQIQIFQLGPNSFCSTADYQGQFVTVAGVSPAGTGAVAAGIKGTMNGGHRLDITGTLKASPSWRTRGSVGTVDYMCDATTSACTGYVSYLDQYFVPGYSADYAWWGWQYRAGSHGSWINAVDETSGDIN